VLWPQLWVLIGCISNRSCWVHPFVQDRDNKSTSQSLILELSSDRENFCVVTRMTSDTVALLQHVRDRMTK
jgi:hypothetical protein